MRGGAGRRGSAAEGECGIALDARDGVDSVFHVVDGAPEPIESRFRLGYGSVALLLGTGAEPDVLRRRIASPFGPYHNPTPPPHPQPHLLPLQAPLPPPPPH